MYDELIMPPKDYLPATTLTTLNKILPNVFSEKQFLEILIHVWPEEQNPGLMDLQKTILECIRKKLFRAEEIPSSKNQTVTLYLKGNPSIYETAVALVPNSYISHQTAAYLNNLSFIPSATIYITSEQSPKERKETVLEQEDVDNAFNKDQKKSNSRFTYRDHAIVLLNGMHTAKEGVLQPVDTRKFSLTNIERTLIDVTVRPAYAGGAMEVLNMYINALKKNMSIEELVGILDIIPFTYPYHQSVGFFLEKAGYKGTFLTKLMKREKLIDFYVDYNIEQKKYSEKWRIFYPAAIDS